MGWEQATYILLSSETRTTLHRNWVPFILSTNLLSKQIRLLLRSARNCAHVIALSSRHLCGVRSWMQITGEAFFSLSDRDGIGGKKMLLNSDTLHINQGKIRIREQISAYKFRPQKLSSVSFQFNIICKNTLLSTKRLFLILDNFNSMNMIDKIGFILQQYLTHSWGFHVLVTRFGWTVLALWESY